MRQQGLKILGEAVLLAAVGLGIGLTANAASEHGIRLDRDYFRTRSMSTHHAVDPAALGSTTTGETNTHPEGSGVDSGVQDVPTDAVAPTPADSAGTIAHGAPTSPAPQPLPYLTISLDDVVTLYTGPEYEFEQSIIIDARDDSHYAEGHIPGAYQLDHYRLDQYLPTVLPACASASRIVVYCNGGKCEDSELAAFDLMDAGVDPNKVFVFLGGAAEWVQSGQPLERGERLSQDLYYPQEQEE